MAGLLKILHSIKKTGFWVFLFSLLFCNIARADMYSVNVPVLNLRACASTNCEIIGKLKQGTTVNTISETGNWVLVKTDKNTGFVIKKSLKKVIKKEESSNPNGIVVISVLLIFLLGELLYQRKNKTARFGIKQNSESAKESEQNTKMAKNALRLLSNRSKEVFGNLWAKREKKANIITAYDVLEIAPTKSQDEIKKAYKNAVKKYHPDHNPDKNAGTKFRKIKKAYDLLSDKYEKAKYDMTLVDRAEVVLLVAFSIQQLRLIIAEDYRIDSKTIKFTQTNDVFINDEFAGRWCEMMGFFVYYKPVKPKEIKFDPTIHEIIYLTSYDMYELQDMIALCFGCESEAIDLKDTSNTEKFAGVVLKFGEYALCWRETDAEFYEFYCPTTFDEPKEAHADEIPDEYNFSDDEDKASSDDIKKLNYDL